LKKKVSFASFFSCSFGGGGGVGSAMLFFFFSIFPVFDVLIVPATILRKYLFPEGRMHVNGLVLGSFEFSSFD